MQHALVRYSITSSNAHFKTFLAAVHMSLGCCQTEKHVHENHLGHHTLNREKTYVAVRQTKQTPRECSLLSLSVTKCSTLVSSMG